ncbi:isocitrate lyase/PEP mutase family protein [Agrobacterium rosae]|uniref:Isocitrate lyase/phosphoenolpyruvate mutase family protein n=1 Tax=Agrobacterium rosae TaxID=1972867 RepID=A0AAE5VQK4_9HYPH|nr:isocitrate lyase/phosphoenolpyruvate mutase family protein [Agrobacterium rosae]KAA3512997.1 isocitrate lyase/phosphoenolpyruvate mutase family protein [Agrobacterium rosae]KAA3521516.1 isocitrate lyase/phosphoenolpyruvate mutase family protein [Agrobacterium rosae]MCM2432613.1 isocitrate lyase/phosphoenolpyruvate mutase family protein [Agrobacterium rosae]MDX8328316.1 isocitrate lyase/phosphoenolpyruvate mutase family protein [Agrobacterium rosae]MQB48432.1 isocitrate lyase/phosphoenolpyru
MSQADKAQAFAQLHRVGDPLFLYNVWDAGGAMAIEDAGAKAIATGSMSMALAHGYEDGQKIPFDLVIAIVSQMCKAVALPVTVDFEGGYAEDLEGLTANCSRLLDAGAIGINFEDQIVDGQGLHTIEKQCDRIATIRHVAKGANIPLFVNARTDLFLQQNDKGKHKTLVADAIERGKAYAHAGASGFFIPGLTDLPAIKEICGAVELPVNVMRTGTTPTKSELASTGISRLSCGPGPYFDFVDRTKAAFKLHDK